MSSSAVNKYQVGRIMQRMSTAVGEKAYQLEGAFGKFASQFLQNKVVSSARHLMI